MVLKVQASQCNKAREYNKRHVDQEEETKSPHTEKYVEHVKEAIRTLKKPQEPYNKEANLTALQGTWVKSIVFLYIGNERMGTKRKIVYTFHRK